MAAAIIELDPLPDAVGPAAQNHDFSPAGGVGFALRLVTGVEIRREAFELRCASVHTAEHGLNTHLLAFRAYRRFIRAPSLGELRIGNSAALSSRDQLL